MTFYQLVVELISIFTSLKHRFTILLLLFTFFEQTLGKIFKLPVWVVHYQERPSENFRSNFLEFIFLNSFPSVGQDNITGIQQPILNVVA